jgi:hypothetical protein
VSEVVALAREYASIWGRPVLRAVDRRIFTLRYFQPCLACGFCEDQCCRHGVDVDFENMQRLLAQGDDFENYVGVARDKWFEPEIVEDDEFPGRRHGRTRTKDGYCVFHEKGGRGCKIHAWTLEKGLDHHSLKPVVSVLFPLTFEKCVLMPSNEVLDGSLVCVGDGKTLYEGARDELAWYFGAGLTVELDALYDTVRASRAPESLGGDVAPARR